MKVTQTLSVQFPIPEKSVKVGDWAGWKRALEILWKQSLKRSWGYIPVRIRMVFFAPSIAPQVVARVLDIMQDIGILLEWRKSMRELQVIREDETAAWCRVVITIERMK